MQARRAALSDGRWHFQHGPIDIVIGAEGEAAVVAAAHEAAWLRFEAVLVELVGELALLRQPVAPSPQPSPTASAANPLRHPIARRMWAACVPYAERFITPMAAVAGAVAQELIAFYDRPGIARAWVNNGGDIALHLAHGARVRVGLFADLARLEDPHAIELDGHFDVRAEHAVRGIATSGWRGRSFSLGIADSVTVLARDAAGADAAATIIANAVDVADPRIRRAPANSVKDDADLGAIPVTVDVPQLESALVEQALRAGEQQARALQRAGLIVAAFLSCQGRTRRIDIRKDPDAIGAQTIHNPLTMDAAALIAARTVGSVFA